MGITIVSIPLIYLVKSGGSKMSKAVVWEG